MILFLLIDYSMYGQYMKFGLPEVHNHSVREYKSGAQNWDVSYYNGHVYFANNDGLLTFDGNNWVTFKTPNETIIRSISISDSGKVYVGAQNELGYFDTSRAGELKFTSILTDKINDLNEIWHLECIKDDIYFSNNDKLFLKSNGALNEVEDVKNITYMTQVDGSIWVICGNSILKKIKNGIIVEKIEAKLLRNKIAAAIYQGFNDKIFIATENHGIYQYSKNTLTVWETNCDNFLKQNQISSVSYSNKQGLLIGTDLGGIVKINAEGNATIHLNKRNGLHNNSISCSEFDEFGNLWLGLYNGIDEVNLNQSLYKFYPDNELQGPIYDVDRWEGKLFFSTSNGLFYIDEKEYYNPIVKTPFILVHGTADQTWSTDVIKGHLYCNHHNGVFKVNLDLTTTQLTKTGAWKFEGLENGNYALGHYSGVSIFKIGQNNILEYSHEVEGISESCRILTYDKFKNLWISHPFKHIFKVNFSENYTRNEISIFNNNNGLEEDLHNYVINIFGHCYATNKKGVYKYNHKRNVFEKDSLLNQIVSRDNYIRRIKNINDKLWFITDKSTFAYKKESSGITTEFNKINTLNINTKENYVGGFEDLFELSDSTLIIPTQEGAYFYNSDSEKTYNQKVVIKNISLPEFQDSILYYGFGEVPSIELKSNENSLKFTFGLTEPSSKNENFYSTQLIGTKDHWSNWHLENTKEYTNLSNGNYQLLVKTKNNRNIESEIYTLEFSIKTPWYKSTMAILFYSICFLAFLLAIIYIPKKKYEEKTAILENENQTKEELLSIIKKEKLEDEIRFKNQELASSALHLLQKNQTLTSVKNKINSLKDKPVNVKIKKDLNEIISIIKSDLRLDEDWSKFSLHFDRVHQDFIKKLKSKYPQLSIKDHKLCAFLKMNLTTKEISPLLNISVRGVEISRYRLRKKLGLDRSVDLSDFLNEL